MADKKTDLAGPGIGDYDELKRILPQDYSSLLTPRETQKAVFTLKNYIEENLCKELKLMMVSVPLIGACMGTPMILCVSYSVKPEAQISFKRSGFAEKLLKTSGDRRSM